MTGKFKSSDRVKIKQTAWLRTIYFSPEDADFVGTVVGYDYDEDELALVKFDNLTNGHSGISYYRKKGIKYDHKNRQHLWVREENLCLIEEGE